MSRKQKIGDVDWSAVENARKVKRVLALKKDEDDCYHCPVINCDHPGFTSKRGCRKHVNNIHPCYFYFDENPGRDISDENTSSSSTQDLEKKTCTIYMPSYPVNSGVALEFSSWLAAICGGGISRSQSQQTASRAMKFLKFCSGEDEDELTSSFIDYCLGCPRLITDFAEVLKNEWKIGRSTQLSYLHAISDLIDFRKADEASEDALRNFAISEVYLTRGKKFLARQKKMEWSRDLDLDSLISANCWASLKEIEKVIPYHLDEFKYGVEKCKCFPLHEVPLQSLTCATRFVAVFLFLRVKSARLMTFQHLTVSMFENSKANNGFIDQKEFKTNLSYTFDSLVLDDLPTRVIALYVEHVRSLLNPQNDCLLLTRNGTQYKKLGNAMCKLVYQAIGKYIHPTRYRQIVETESAKMLCLEDQKNISLDQKHSSQVARIYYRKNSSRCVAVDGQISMRKLFGGSHDTSDTLIKSMLFSEKSESDISKASLKEIKTIIVLMRKKMMWNP